MREKLLQQISHSNNSIWKRGRFHKDGSLVGWKPKKLGVRSGPERLHAHGCIKQVAAGGNPEHGPRTHSSYQKTHLHSRNFGHPAKHEIENCIRHPTKFNEVRRSWTEIGWFCQTKITKYAPIGDHLTSSGLFVINNSAQKSSFF